MENGVFWVRGVVRYKKGGQKSVRVSQTSEKENSTVTFCASGESPSTQDGCPETLRMHSASRITVPTIHLQHLCFKVLLMGEAKKKCVKLKSERNAFNHSLCVSHIKFTFLLSLCCGVIDFLFSCLLKCSVLFILFFFQSPTL